MNAFSSKARQALSAAVISTALCVPAMAQDASLLPLSLDAHAGGPAIVTLEPDLLDGATVGDYVLAIIDTRAPTLNSPGFATRWVPSFYHNEFAAPDDVWDEANLGPLFGLALGSQDGAPDIYATTVAHHALDGWPCSDAQPCPDGARVHRISGSTGAITRNLPPTPGGTINRAGLVELPGSYGLGNVSYSSDHDLLYVTNFEDGKIYRLDPNASVGSIVLDAFDPFTADVSGAEPAPYHERVFGVQVYNGRVYYGTWEDQHLQGQVWSTQLDAGGGFVVDTEQLELTLPPSPLTSMDLPISDIAFSADGDMLVAERMMSGGTTSFDFVTGVYEYTWDASIAGWVPGGSFPVGPTIDSRNGNGGVDYDCQEQWDGNHQGAHAYATGDYLLPDDMYSAYGVQIFDDDGGDMWNSYQVDIEGLHDDDMTYVNDVEVVRPRDCSVQEPDPDEPAEDGCLLQLNSGGKCVSGPDDSSVSVWNVAVDLEVQNATGVAAVFLADPNITGVTQFVNAAQGEHITLEFQFESNDSQGGIYCVQAAVFDSEGEECCSQEICFELEPCSECLVGEMEAVCEEVDGEPFWNISLDVTSLSPEVIEHLFVANAIDGLGFYFDVPTTSTGDGIAVDIVVPHEQTLLIDDARCVFVALHDETLEECCWELLCDDNPEDCFDERAGVDPGYASEAQQVTYNENGVDRVGCTQTKTSGREAAGLVCLFGLIWHGSRIRRRRRVARARMRSTVTSSTIGGRP